MHRAMELARQALGSTSPNPAVGAVIVQDGRIVGEGFTQPAGQDHAEIVALTQAGEKARCSAMYVTLEPCPHLGRTLPCTEAILREGISEVHFSLMDPNPLVSGKGLRELQENGVKVYTGQGEDLSRRLNEAYFKYVTYGTPFVTAKFAASLDGKIAARSGDSHWISSGESRQWAHKTRAASDAVMVGIGTVLADDPMLTARDENNVPLCKQPLRVIVDSRLSISSAARLFSQPGPILIAASHPTQRAVSEIRALGADAALLPAEDGHVDLEALLCLLGERQVTSLMVEGGSGLLGSFFDRNLVDKVAACIAPVIIGGTAAKPAVGGHGSNTLAEAYRLRGVEVELIGADLIVTGYPYRGDQQDMQRGLACLQES